MECNGIIIYLMGYTEKKKTWSILKGIIYNTWKMDDLKSGWLLTYPSEKYDNSQLGWWNSQYLEK